jgi:RecB family endonuclease NucS
MQTLETCLTGKEEQEQWRGVVLAQKYTITATAILSSASLEKRPLQVDMMEL